MKNNEIATTQVTVVDTLCSIPGMQGVVMGVYDTLAAAYAAHPQPERECHTAPKEAAYLSEANVWLDKDYNPI